MARSNPLACQMLMAGDNLEILHSRSESAWCVACAFSDARHAEQLVLENGMERKVCRLYSGCRLDVGLRRELGRHG